mmetsp:Transcript_29509/g.70110  ORF Transcript_29509/g.70110 Transcript_29509/m.70110 type:complete len:219 (+) Transcript_29509:307-963(+)
MSFLRHLGGSGKASSDCPNRLVRNTDVGPFVLAQDFSKRCHLLRAHVHGRTGLTLLLLLPDAEHDLQALVNRKLRLISDKLRVLTSHSKPLAPLRVTKDDPLEAKVLELRCAHLAGMRASSRQGRVLCGNLDVRPERIEKHRDVDERGPDNNISVRRDRSGSIELGDQLFHACDGTVGLPVSSDEVRPARGHTQRRADTLAGDRGRSGGECQSLPDHG